MDMKSINKISQQLIKYILLLKKPKKNLRAWFVLKHTHICIEIN